jgi:PAS domain S-box-containing protein
MSGDFLVERASTNGGATGASLEELLTFERLLADLSARFASVSIGQVEAEIDSALNHLQEFLGFDRGNFYEFTADGWATIIGSAARAGAERLPLGPAPPVLRWFLSYVRAGKVLRVQSIEDYPPEATEQIAYHRRIGIRSSLGLPLRVSGRVVGVITFVSFRTTRNWPDDLIGRLKLFGEVMAQALMRKRAETALRASEERWRSMFEASNLGIAVLDENLHYVATNPPLQAMLGFTEDELQQLTPLDVTAEEDRAATRALLTELQRGERDHFDTSKQFRRKDGTLIWAHSYVSAVRDGGSRTKMFIGTVIDTTEAKRAQDALRETQSNLERVTRLTTMHAVTASIAHEVNQPLAAIVTAGDAALTWLRRTPPEVGEAAKIVDQIISDGYRASQVVTSVRTMFKKDEHAKACLDVNEVIEEVLTVLRGELNKKRVLVRTKLGRELPPISADRVQLQQVVLNLVMNAGEAMDAMPVGARRLTIRSRASAPNEVIIAIEDSGPGIDAKDTERIFDAFFTTKPQGMGMGLSICRSIVEAHGGRLWAAAREPQGSVFYVKLQGVPSQHAVNDPSALEGLRLGRPRRGYGTDRVVAPGGTRSIGRS